LGLVLASRRLIALALQMWRKLVLLSSFFCSFTCFHNCKLTLTRYDFAFLHSLLDVFMDFIASNCIVLLRNQYTHVSTFLYCIWCVNIKTRLSCISENFHCNRITQFGIVTSCGVTVMVVVVVTKLKVLVSETNQSHASWVFILVLSAKHVHTKLISNTATLDS
jgi:hypothetical protein